MTQKYWVKGFFGNLWAGCKETLRNSQCPWVSKAFDTPMCERVRTGRGYWNSAGKGRVERSCDFSQGQGNPWRIIPWLYSSLSFPSPTQASISRTQLNPGTRKPTDSVHTDQHPMVQGVVEKGGEQTWKGKERAPSHPIKAHYPLLWLIISSYVSPSRLNMYCLTHFQTIFCTMTWPLCFQSTFFMAPVCPPLRCLQININALAWIMPLWLGSCLPHFRRATSPFPPTSQSSHRNTCHSRNTALSIKGLFFCPENTSPIGNLLLIL